MLLENPILRGWHPDPCFCAARGKYYLACSTFQWVPAVSIYESEDLVEWRSLGGALENLDLRGIPDSAGVWAPDLTYDEDSGLFWLVYTVARNIDGIFKDVSNYVVTASSVEGPWSDPVFINASGFDPGAFHENGRHYILNPQWDPRPLEGHHRFNGLVMQEFSLERGLVGEAHTVLGNADAVNWLREGPHIMKRDGWYYIACAEGGTGRRHRIRMARSRELWGPYEVASEPLVCAWCTPSPLRKAGHGNFVQGPQGDWYVCHLASRYLPGAHDSACAYDEAETGISPLGRESSMQRVEWNDGWPVLVDGGESGYEPSPTVGVAGVSDRMLATAVPGQKGYAYRTAFGPECDLWREEWLCPRHFDDGAVSQTSKGLVLRGADSPSSLLDRSALMRRVTSFHWHAETELSFSPGHYNQSAGLICEYDSRAFFYLSVSWDEDRNVRVIDVLTCDNGAFDMPLGKDTHIVVPERAEHIALAADVDGRDLVFSVAFDGGALAPVLCRTGEVLKLDFGVLSDEHVAGWAYTGSMVGVTCIDMWDKTANATFASFEYRDVEEGVRPWA